jgi:hypothetical protein
MQTLRFDTAVTGLSSHSALFVAGTEDGSVFVVNPQTGSIDRQFSLPCEALAFGAPVWSRDGDFIWVPSGCNAFFLRPTQASPIESVRTDLPIERLFAHPDGISVLALHSDATLSLLRPSGPAASRSFSPAPISFVTIFESKPIVVTPSSLLFIDAASLEPRRSLDFPQRRPPIAFARGTDSGVLVIWSDGFWTRLGEGAALEGACPPASAFDVAGSHLCAACGDCVRVFDLRFDAELQSIAEPATLVLLFPQAVVAASARELRVRPWRGLRATTTRDLLRSARPAERRELTVALAPAAANLEAPAAAPVALREPQFRVRSVVRTVDRVIARKFVPQAARDAALARLADAEYADIRDLARFHLAAAIPFEDVRAQLLLRRSEHVLLMLKKVEPLSGGEIAEFVRTALGMGEEGEVLLAHFLIQPHAERAAREGAALLTVEEADALFFFLARIVRSRRYWREFHPLFGAFDAVLAWAGWLIAAAFGALVIQRKVAGVRALREELAEEVERIEAAGVCWSIMENIQAERQETLPPSFVYLVEKVTIALPD